MTQENNSPTSVAGAPVSRTAVAPSNQTSVSGRPARPRRSRKTVVNFWLDTFLLLVFIMLGTVVVILQFVFPPGVAARDWTLWGATYGAWCGLQFALFCTFALAILVHVMLHWTWVCGVVSRQFLGRSKLPGDGTRTILGVGLLIVLLNIVGIVVAAANLSIRSPDAL